MCYVMTGDVDGGDGLIDRQNFLLVLGPHLGDAERVEAARRAWGPEDQLTDDGTTALCLCGCEVDVSRAGEGAYV